MIRITPAAAEQVRKSAEQAGITATPCLRLAVTIGDDKAFEYGMGFDERKDGDVHAQSEGIDLVFADRYKEALMGAVLDYVEINPGEHRFIFSNPNDPAHTSTRSSGRT